MVARPLNPLTPQNRTRDVMTSLRICDSRWMGNSWPKRDHALAILPGLTQTIFASPVVGAAARWFREDHSGA